MPGSQDIAAVRQASDALSARLEAHHAAVLAATTATQAIAETESYASDGAVLVKALFSACHQMMSASRQSAVSVGDAIGQLLAAALREHVSMLRAAISLDELRALCTQHRQRMRALVDHMALMADMMDGMSGR